MATPSNRPQALRKLLNAADQRDVKAEKRDAGYRAIAQRIRAGEVDPVEAATHLEAALHAGGVDRDSAAADREQLVRLLEGRGDDVDLDFTDREVEVLRHLADAKSTREIAEAMILGVNTIKSHTRTLYAKIGVKSRAQAALWAREHGYGSPSA